MLKVLLHGPRDIRVQDVPVPEPGPDQLRARVSLASIYGTDLKFYTGFHVVPYPTGLGADFVGVVDAVGGNVDGFELGDRIVATDMPHCGQCRMCSAGRTNLCLSILDPMQHRGECFQEYALVDARRAHAVPPEVSDPDAATLAAINMAFNALELAALPPRSRVAVVGIGAMGTGIVQVARHLGHEVAALHRDDSRDDLASALGASFAVPTSRAADVLARRWPDGPDAVIDAAGHEATAHLALELVAPGGTVVLIGTGAWGLASRPISHKEVRVVGVRGGHHQARAVRTAAEGQVGLGITIGATFDLSQAERAFVAAENDKSLVRVGLRVQEEEP